jgi:hypothetical protein
VPSTRSAKCCAGEKTMLGNLDKVCACIPVRTTIY